MNFDHNNFLVKPRSWESIDRDAWLMRKAYGFDSTKYFPVMATLEQILYNSSDAIQLEIVENDEASGYEGCTSIDGKTIFLKKSVYEGACSGFFRDRFTVAHELGHAFLHAGQTPVMALLSKHPDKPYCQSEAQANRFAAALLMPFELICPSMSPSEATKVFGVSKSTATYRIRDYRKNLKQNGPEQLL
tara:strand:- start:1011 stop:1577 length:567 start_codon:yes stop_codon:yes gene_type:complete